MRNAFMKTIKSLVVIQLFIGVVLVFLFVLWLFEDDRADKDALLSTIYGFETFFLMASMFIVAVVPILKWAGFFDDKR